MRIDGVRLTPRAMLWLLAAGWVAGLVLQVATRVSTGYMDLFPPHMLLGALLCIGAGFAARVIDPVRRGPVRGVLAGVAMLASIVLGYAVLTFALWNPAWSGGGGETWYSLLLEAPFWVGIPLATGAGFGALGWYVADRMTRPAQPTAHPR